MTTQFEFDRELALWLGSEHPATAPAAMLETVTQRVAVTRRRPGLLVVDRWTWRRPSQTLASTGRLGFVTLLSLLLAGLLAVGGLVVGSWLDQRRVLIPVSPGPSALVPPTNSPSAFAVPTAPVSPTPSHLQGLVAYTVNVELQPGQGDCEPVAPHACLVGRLWIANADGSNPRELMPGEFDNQELIAWSPEGSRLLFRNGLGNLVLTDAQGSARQVISRDSLCHPAGNCGSQFFSFSPDGTRLGYAYETNDPPLSSVIAIYDLATGDVTELESTRTRYVVPCIGPGANEGVNDYVEWSPDGTRLVFGRQTIGPPDGDSCRSAVFTVNVDSSDLRQIVPTEPGGLHPRWSPDGSLIVFGSHVATSGVYTIRSNGSDLRQLTTDAALPRWTADGQIVFFRVVGQGTDQESLELWIMNADGSGQARLESSSLADLAAVNCTTCPYPVSTDGGVPVEAMWQPKP